jgi:hypothetical protein
MVYGRSSLTVTNDWPDRPVALGTASQVLHISGWEWHHLIDTLMAWLIWNHPKPVEFHFHSNVTEVLLTDPAIGIGAAILPMRAVKKIVVLLVNIQMNQVCDIEFTRKMSLLLCHSAYACIQYYLLCWNQHFNFQFSCFKHDGGRKSHNIFEYIF